jgi:CelD/BcsL family acetyltransferase involved in cellulose biosynthesis
LPGSLRTRELKEIGAFEQLSPEWNDLWGRAANATTFQRPEWLLPYMQVFQTAQLWGIEVRQGERLVALAPLCIENKEGERVVAPIGLGVSDYLDVLVDPAEGNAALSAVLNHFAEHRDEWEIIRFSDLRDTSLLLQSELPDGWERAVSPREACPVLDLPKSFDELADTASTRLLASLRNARRRLERHGSFTVEVATEETLPGMLDAFFELHGKRWNQLGTSGVLADASVKSFHCLAAPALLRRGVLRLFVLRLDRRRIAVLYAFFEKRTAYCYLQGFDPAFGTYSPGGLILEAVIRRAIEEEKSAADFLRGRETYKYRWGARDHPTFSVQIRKRAPSKNEIAA